MTQMHLPSVFWVEHETSGIFGGRDKCDDWRNVEGNHSQTRGEKSPLHGRNVNSERLL